MTAKTPKRKHSSDLEVAVIGNFQIGKSTFVNCLVGRNDAAMGNGLCTTHNAKSYSVCRGVSIIDTPGFNAPGSTGEKDVKEAREAIRRSFVVIVYLDKPMDDLCRSLVEEVRDRGRRCVFVYNCKDESRWDPCKNDEICRSIEGDIESAYAATTVMLGGRYVHRINAKWALFGMGLLTDEDDVEYFRWYASHKLKISEGVDLKSELLRRSNLSEVKRYIMNLPLEVISDFLNNRDREMKRLTDRFCEEFSKRIVG